MNFLRPAVIIFLLCIISASGCIQPGVYSKNNSQSDTKTQDSASFVKAAEDILKIHIFEDTVIKNILSPDIFTELGQYPQINYELSQVFMSSGKENPLHLLKNTSETIYIISGSAEAEINGISYSLTPGDTIFIPENALQTLKNTGDNELSYLSITYPPYNTENEEIFEEDLNETAFVSEKPVFIGGNDSSKKTFFEDVGVTTILSPAILKESGTNFEFGIGIAKAEIPRGSLTTPHILEGTTEVMYVLSGDGILHVNKNSMEIKAGDTAYIPPGAYQSLENSGNESLVYITITDPAYSESVDSSVST